MVLRCGKTAKASAEFASSWDVLEAFAASAPAERIRSDFMLNFVLEFKVIDCSFLIRCFFAVHSLAEPPSSHASPAQATQSTSPPASDPSQGNAYIAAPTHPHQFLHSWASPPHTPSLFTTLCGPMQTPAHQQSQGRSKLVVSKRRRFVRAWAQAPEALSQLGFEL